MRFVRSNILGLVAIFIALGGVAVAVQKNTITSKHIVKGGVRSSDVRDDTKPKGGLKSRDVAPDALTGADVREGTLFNDDSLTGADVGEGTLFNDDSLTGADIDESTLAQVPTAAAADTVDGLDSSALATGSVSITATNFRSSTVQSAFMNGVVVPGLGTLQIRCSAFNPNHWIVRFRNESPVALDVEIRDGEVAHLSDVTNPIPPFGPEPQHIAPGQTGPEVDLADTSNEDSLTLWHVTNDSTAANFSPQRFARFEVLSSGSGLSCFLSILTIAGR